MFKNKSSLIGLIDMFLLERMKLEGYNVKSVNPIQLISWNRLDLAFKKIFLELKKKNYSVARRFYWEDIRSQTLGQFQELGNADKSSFDVYENVFNELEKSFAKNNFCEETSLIPLANDGTILNGSHRTALALHEKNNLMAVETCLEPIVPDIDYDYFFKRAVPPSIVETAVSKLLECGEDFYICFLWSSGKSNWNQTYDLFSNIAFKKDVQLTINGAINLLYECYSHMDWIGTEKNKFRGLRNKLLECFPKDLSCKIIIFQEKRGIENVLELKRKIRGINNIGFSSVHITDSKSEVLRLSEYLLNRNGIHFLNNSSPESFRRASLKIKALKEELGNCFVLNKDFAVDGSFVLEMYGIRKSRDIDYLVSDSASESVLQKLGSRDEQLVFHSVSKSDLIYDPEYHFYFHGVKIISLKQVYKMKKKRGEVKDIIDCKSINLLLDQRTKLRRYLLTGLQFILYTQIKIRCFMFKFIFFIISFLGLRETLLSIRSRLLKFFEY